MSPESSKVSSTQIGQVGEAIVAARLALDSGGRLMIFNPYADDGGLDLLAYDKVTGTSWPIQVKSRTKTVANQPKTVHFGVRKATFSAMPHAMLLGVLLDLDENRLGIKRAWLIPMEDLPVIANENETIYKIRPSIDMNSNDKYTPYRCESMAQVVQRLLIEEKP